MIRTVLITALLLNACGKDDNDKDTPTTQAATEEKDEYGLTIAEREQADKEFNIMRTIKFGDKLSELLPEARDVILGGQCTREQDDGTLGCSKSVGIPKEYYGFVIFFDKNDAVWQINFGGKLGKDVPSISPSNPQ